MIVNSRALLDLEVDVARKINSTIMKKVDFLPHLHPLSIQCCKKCVPRVVDERSYIGLF